MNNYREIKKLIEEIRADANKIGNYSGYCKEKINILNNVGRIEKLLNLKENK